MLYLGLFIVFYVVWVIGGAVMRAMVVTTEQPKDGEFLRLLINAGIWSLSITLIVFVIRGGQ